MKQTIYLNTSGILQRKDNSLYYETDETRKPLPIETIEAIYAFGSIQVNSNTLELLGRHSIPVHFFGYYGNYVGTFYPREQFLAGSIIVKQVEHYLDPEKRMYLAQQFISGAISNLRKNVDDTSM